MYLWLLKWKAALYLWVWLFTSQCKTFPFEGSKSLMSVLLHYNLREHIKLILPLQFNAVREFTNFYKLCNQNVEVNKLNRNLLLILWPLKALQALNVLIHSIHKHTAMFRRQVSVNSHNYCKQGDKVIGIYYFILLFFWD